MSGKKYEVRAMTPDDLPGAEDLFKAAYDRASMGPEHRRWFVHESALGSRVGYVAQAPDGRIVGHVSYVPVPFRREGRRALGAFMVQAMIHPEFQKQGIFKALVKACEREHDARGVEVLQAFPNDNSIHAFIAHFGWQELTGPNYIYFKILDWPGVLASRVHSDAVRRLLARRSRRQRTESASTIRKVDKIDSRVDALWQAFARDVPSGIERSSEYLEWRLAPLASSYDIFQRESSGQLDGLVITKCEERFGLRVGYIVELLFEPSRADVGRKLVRHAVDHLRALDCEAVLAATAAVPAVRRVFYRTGFWHLPKRLMPHGIHFVYKFRDRTASDRRRNDYFVSWLDHDLI